MQKRVPLIQLSKKPLHSRVTVIADWEIDVLESEVIAVVSAVRIAVLLVYLSV